MSENTNKRPKLAHSRQIRVGSVDLDTGEIIDGGGVFVQRPVKIKHFTQDYMIMFLQSFALIAQDKDLRGETTAVLLYIVSKAQMKNWVQLQQKEIGEALGMKVPNVSRALKKLQEKGLIEATTKLGKAKSYRVSMDFGWRGPGKAYTEEKTLRLVKAMRAHTER